MGWSINNRDPVSGLLGENSEGHPEFGRFLGTVCVNTRAWEYGMSEWSIYHAIMYERASVIIWPEQSRVLAWTALARM